MKKLFACLLAGLVVTLMASSASYSQAFTDDGTIQGELEVVEALTVSTSGTVDFGAVESTNSAYDVTIGPGGISSTGGGITGATSTATLTISTASTQNAIVSYSAGSLTNGTDNINFTPILYTGATNATSVSDGSSIGIAQGNTYTIGGTAGVPNDPSDGVYTGTSTVTIAYTGL